MSNEKIVFVVTTNEDVTSTSEYIQYVNGQMLEFCARNRFKLSDVEARNRGISQNKQVATGNTQNVSITAIAKRQKEMSDASFYTYEDFFRTYELVVAHWSNLETEYKAVFDGRYSFNPGKIPLYASKYLKYKYGLDIEFVWDDDARDLRIHTFVANIPQGVMDVTYAEILNSLKKLPIAL